MTRRFVTFNHCLFLMVSIFGKTPVLQAMLLMELSFTCHSKKTKGKDLTEEQKKINKKISSKRVYVEHVICRVKVYRIVKECLRCHKFGIEDIVMQIACALINYKLSMKTSSIAA